MNFDWTHYIRLAESLEREAGKLADWESCLRSAISRAYYGAFGRAKEVAVAYDGLTLTRTPQDHRRIIRHFRGSPHRIRRRIGVALDRLRRARNQADYDDQFSGLQHETSLSLQRARQIEHDLTRL